MPSTAFLLFFLGCSPVEGRRSHSHETHSNDKYSINVLNNLRVVSIAGENWLAVDEQGFAKFITLFTQATNKPLVDEAGV